MYLATFDIKIIIHFPAKNNFMLVTPRTVMRECNISWNNFYHDGFPDCILWD